MLVGASGSPQAAYGLFQQLKDNPVLDQVIGYLNQFNQPGINYNPTLTKAFLKEGGTAANYANVARDPSLGRMAETLTSYGVPTNQWLGFHDRMVQSKLERNALADFMGLANQYGMPADVLSNSLSWIQNPYNQDVASALRGTALEPYTQSVVNLVNRMRSTWPTGNAQDPTGGDYYDPTGSPPSGQPYYPSGSPSKPPSQFDQWYPPQPPPSQPPTQPPPGQPPTGDPPGTPGSPPTGDPAQPWAPTGSTGSPTNPPSGPTDAPPAYTQAEPQKATSAYQKGGSFGANWQYNTLNPYRRR